MNAGVFRRILIVSAFLIFPFQPGFTQEAVVSPHQPVRFASNIIVPQRRVFVTSGVECIQITGVKASVDILKQVAKTTIDIDIHNPASRQLEAEIMIPVPPGAVIRGFTFQGNASEPTAKVLPKDEARKTYDSIVARLRDPALLEFSGMNMIRSSVFPVEAGGNQKIRVTYEHILSAQGNRIDYVLPRSESVDFTIPWDINVTVAAEGPVSTVYSPSHKTVVVRDKGSTNRLSVRVAPEARTEPGPFRLSYILSGEDMSASLFAYPDPGIRGGYFLFLAGLPASDIREKQKMIKREVTMVFDRSGSMNGEKIEQVREVALQVVAGLEYGESFNIIVYNENVDYFSRTPVIKTKETEQQVRNYIKSINARGGTNIHDALLEALRQKPTEGTLPIILFLTDGLPTIGQTSEKKIASLASEANPFRKRIFTFGAGLDVNTPLLDKIAVSTRAFSTYVLPEEDVEVKVAKVFSSLSGPVMAFPEIRVTDSEGNDDPRRTMDLIPAVLPDLYKGDQLVLLGQYTGEEPLNFRLSGNYLGTPKQFPFSFSLESATVENSFVPRLWGARKIAVLIDAIRDMGADTPMFTAEIPDPSKDRRLKELVDEIIRISMEFGILTEYTSFLAREGTDLTRRDEIEETSGWLFSSRAIGTRSGRGSVNQSMNSNIQRAQTVVNSLNSYFDQNMKQVSLRNVQQVSNTAFFRRGNRWIDSRLLRNNKSLEPDRVIEIGSEEHRKLVDRLEEQGRQSEAALEGETLIEVDDQSVLVK